MESSYNDIAMIFKAFSKERRLAVLKMLQSGEKCACEILENMDISQPTLSHHMKILVESGVIRVRKDGNWTHYSFAPEGTERAKQFLDTLNRNNSVRDTDCALGSLTD